MPAYLCEFRGMLVQVAKFDSRIEAEIVRGRLASEGVVAILFDEGLSSLGIGSLTPVRLMVDDSDQSLAESLLREDLSRETGEAGL